MARGRDHAKEQHWRRHMAAWRRSGWSVRDYCDSAGLAEASFYAWRRVLAEREGCPATNRTHGGIASEPAPVGPAAVSAFVPVRLVDDAATTSAVEVVLRGGRVVRVAAGFTAKTLRDVVAVLEDLPC